MMRKLLKKYLVKKWAREIASEFTTTPQVSKGNICGLGGQYFQPYHKTWLDIFHEDPLSYPDVIKSSITFRELLFFGYFGPLEAWCEKYLQGTYYLWPDGDGVRLILTEERDRVFWELKWGANLPPAHIMNKGVNV